MKSKLLLGALLLTFSAFSFATGTIECTGNNAKSANGSTRTISIFLNVGFETGELASDLSLTPDTSDTSDDKFLTLTEESVSQFKNNSKKLLIKASDKNKNAISLSFDKKNATGVMSLTANGDVQTSNEVTCDLDY